MPRRALRRRDPFGLRRASAWPLALALAALLAAPAAALQGASEGEGTGEAAGAEGGASPSHAHGTPGAEVRHEHEAGGHTLHHRFDDAERWAERFEDPERDAWQRPEVVLRALALAPHHVVADIGSATGYFPVRIAPRVPEGRVWGVDVEPAMVRYLNERARSEGISNLFSVLGTPRDPLLPEPAHRVLMVNTFHHVAERSDYFARVAEEMAPEGRLVIVDFKMGERPVGPPDRTKIPPAQVRRELEAAGFTLEDALEDALPHQYILIFRRP